jgi:Zn-finger nucleic acid-binding protein
VPYRDPHQLVCPVCQVALRVERDRLYCDACGGMLIDIEDLVTTIELLVEIEPEVEFVMGAAGTRPCPRCASPMETCRLHVAWFDDAHVKVAWDYDRVERGRTLRCELDRCSAHGVWFDRGELPDIIDRLRGATRRKPLELFGPPGVGGASGE